MPLRRAILNLGVGLWHCDLAARACAAGLRERGKPGAIITCALGRRANETAFAMVRDQTLYDPTCWPTKEPDQTQPNARFPSAVDPARLAVRKAGSDVARAMTDPFAGHAAASLTPGLPPLSEPGRSQLPPPGVEVA